MTDPAPSVEGSILDNAISNVTDPALRATLVREVERLRGSRRFGLVFDRHLPESVRLPEHPIRKGVGVSLRDESSTQVWRVVGFTDSTRSTVRLSDDSERAARDLIVVREFGEPVYPGLSSVQSISNGQPDGTWHTVINGENYHVLQALRSTHGGKVDLIYIDPPYNTGNDGWIYNDKYIDANDRARSSKWLSFMERRLIIAKDLLKSSGVLIVAIGDDEHHRLRMLLDQVFEPQNFLSNVSWQGGRKNDSRYVSNGADYMLIYARDESVLKTKEVRWREEKAGVRDALAAAAAIWDECEGDHATATKQWKAWVRDFHAHGGSKSVTRYDSLDDQTGFPVQTGNLTSPNPRPNLQYDVPHPVTGKPVRRHANGWRVSRDVMAAMIDQGLVRFGPDENSSARSVTFLHELTDEVPESYFLRDRNPAGIRLGKMLGTKRFPYPKDHEVLMRWFRIAAPSDAVVLDFFGGSGSASEAVMALNAEDGGRRQSILVTNNEVGPKQATALRKVGHHPGDSEWEAEGVFEYVTRPRLSTVVTGKRPDGSTYSDGLGENIEFFNLTYLDPGLVRRGREFATIAPLLWLEAGAVGERIDAEVSQGWVLASNYGVLFSPDALQSFAAAVVEATRGESPPSVVFVITDSPSELQHAVERLPLGLKVVQLYEDYLTRYTINTDGSSR